MENSKVKAQVAMKFFVALSMVGIVGMLTVMGILLWWGWPVNVLTITKETQVIGGPYRVGDQLLYTFDYCKYRDLSAEVHYYWMDTVVYSQPTVTLHRLHPGCHTLTEGIEVPRIPPGKYRLNTVRVYEVSPLRNVEVQDTSNEFEIVE
jgi:hypothetical protein